MFLNQQFDSFQTFPFPVPAVAKVYLYTYTRIIHIQLTDELKMLANDHLKEKNINKAKKHFFFKDCNVHYVKIEHYEVILLREYDFECAQQLIFFVKSAFVCLKF